MKIDFSAYENFRTSWDKRRESLIEIRQRYVNFTGTIFFFGDLHGLTAEAEYLRELLKRIKATKGKKLIVLLGDLVTFDAFSNFDGETLDDYTDEEIEATQRLLGELIKYGQVIYIYGNHEMRLDRFLSRKLNGRSVIIRKLIGDWLKLKEKSLTSRVTLLTDWFVIIGDILACHPDKGLGSPLRTAASAGNYFRPRLPDVQKVVVAHTHNQGWCWVEKTQVYELGAMCGTQDYATIAQGMRYKNLQYGGFAIANMRQGKTDFNSVEIRSFGYEKQWL